MLLSLSTNVHVLESLATGPKPLTELRRRAGAPQTTMRGYLRTLTETGILLRSRRNDFPGSADFELTAAGRDLIVVKEILGAWLSEAPEGGQPLGSEAAKSAIKALIEGWNTCMMRAFAAKPLSLTELDSVITSRNYPSLERRLAAMRLAGQVMPLPSPGRARPYAATDWLRRSIAPLTAAARWERRYGSGNTVPFTHLDVETAFLLAISALDLPSDTSGSCRLSVDVPGENQAVAGALVTIARGVIVSCTSRIEGEAESWASGSFTAWFRAVIDGHTDMLELGGDCTVASPLLDRLHKTLFGVRSTAVTPTVFL
jgi:DNA-binding HxlR family transcriptional regulator